MNSKKRFLMTSALAISMVPFHTHAITSQAGLEACADALVSELSKSNGTAVSYTLDSASDRFSGKIKSVENISLYARDPQSSELVSRMDCLINSRGRVVRLTNIPLDSEETTNRISKVD